MTEKRTREAQYQFQVRRDEEHGRARLGLMTSAAWHQDPRRLLFMLSRYKFVAKMLAGKKNVLEIGCGDAFGTRIVQQTVSSVTAVDFDPLFVADANERMDPDWPFDCQVHDILERPVDGTFDAAFSLDVMEHIPPADEERYLANIIKSLASDGVLIVGMPSLQSQAYASPASKEGHVNCKDEPGLRSVMEQHFHNVLTFSMND
ncbi:MAG: class I SAM-dependent methyltransferase, partial [Xanthobacteraceae bacterium]